MGFIATMFMLGMVSAAALIAGLVMSFIGLFPATMGFWSISAVCVYCGYLVSRREGY